MPEVVFAQAVKSAGGSDFNHRVGITLLSALDRARDATKLWTAGAAAWSKYPWLFDAMEVASRTWTSVQRALVDSRIAQRPRMDTVAWKVISKSLAERSGDPIAEAVWLGSGNAGQLLAALRDTSARSRYPYLRGPKIGPMWIRLLAYPGGASLARLDLVPVAVDTQVAKVTRYLGVVPGASMEDGLAIQDAWRADVGEGGSAGPGQLANTCAGLDPTLWFYGKWGCSFCERVKQRSPISPLCSRCTYDAWQEADRTRSRKPAPHS
jgi:hypothetical protein